MRREMEKDGLIHRESFNELPPRWWNMRSLRKDMLFTMPSLHFAIGAKHFAQKGGDLTNKVSSFLSILGIMGKLKIFFEVLLELNKRVKNLSLSKQDYLKENILYRHLVPFDKRNWQRKSH